MNSRGAHRPTDRNFESTWVSKMKIVMSAALGAFVLVASPATAQLYKPGTVTATPRLAQDRPAATQKHKSVVQPFYKAGSTNFMLEQANRRQARMPMDEHRPADAERTSSCCCKHDDAAGCTNDGPA